jgi:hypothetical protein
MEYVKIGEQALRSVLNAATSLPRHTAGFCFGQREYSPTVQRNLIESSIDAEIQQSSSGNMTEVCGRLGHLILGYSTATKDYRQRNLNRYAQRYVARRIPETKRSDGHSKESLPWRRPPVVCLSG